MGVNSCGTTLIDQGVFKNIGAITWDTTVKTSGFTAVSGNGYFCNTTSAAFTVTLPASPSAGDVVAIADYANTFDTNNVTIGRNGSNIQGSAEDFIADIEGLSITLIYVDGTQGWLSIDAAQANDITIPPEFTTATGGTITTSGDFKIHTFTSPGTFCVSQIGNVTTNPSGGPSNVDYLVVAGGGGGGGRYGSGAGAGGYRTSFPSPGCNAGSFPITATGFSITVGAGGAGSSAPINGANGSNGSNSVFSSITSLGGGGGATRGTDVDQGNGSGGGAKWRSTNFGDSTANGNNGGISSNTGSDEGSAGGGGAGAVGGNTPSIPRGGPGGAGLSSSITGSAVTRAGGGGGNGASPTPGLGGSGGYGGGGTGGSSSTAGTNASSNTGSGGGGGGTTGVAAYQGGNGGSGIVIIRYKFQ